MRNPLRSHEILARVSVIALLLMLAATSAEAQGFLHIPKLFGHHDAGPGVNVTLVRATPVPGGPPPFQTATESVSTSLATTFATTAAANELSVSKVLIRPSNGVGIGVDALIAPTPQVAFNFLQKKVQVAPDAIAAAVHRAASVFRRIRSVNPPAAGVVHDTVGISVSAPLTAIRADHTIYPDLKIPNVQENIFSPTLLGAGSDCIEVVTAYSALAPQIWAYDWCDFDAPAPAATLNLTPEFTRDYLRDLSGQGVAQYTAATILSADGTTWAAEIYDYSNNRWTVFYTTKQTARFQALGQGGIGGWTMFEDWATAAPGPNTQADFCPSLDNLTFIASNVMVASDRANPAFRPLLPSLGSALLSDSVDACPSLHYETIDQNSHWKVNRG